MSERSENLSHKQESQFASPWPASERVMRLLWEFSWTVFCVWTPKPANGWRLFWLRVFGAKIDGTPFVHQRARIAVPWNLTLRDRACLGDRANVYSLGEIEIGVRAIVAQEAYLSTGTHDFTHPEIPLLTSKISIGDDAFIGARAFIMPGIRVGSRSIVGAGSVVTKDVPEGWKVAGNPARQIGIRS